MKRLIALVCIASELVGCGSTALRSARAERAPTVSHSREATVIHVSEGTLDASAWSGYQSVTCNRPPSSETGGLAPVLIPLAGVAADSLVGMISSLLTKAKDKRTATWTATLGGVSLQPGKNYCLAISRGIISDLTGGGKSATLDPRLSFEGMPTFVLLADVAVSLAKDATTPISLTITPKLLSYADTSAPNRGNEKKDVSVLMAFSCAAKSATKPMKPATAESGGRVAGGDSAAAVAPAKDAKKPPAGKDDADKTPNAPVSPNSIRLDFGRLDIGHVYGPALLIPATASLTVDSGGLFAISAVVTESEDPNIALSAFAAAFDSNKDDVTAAVKKAVGGGKK